MVNKIKCSNNHDKASLKIEWVNFDESPLAEPLTEKGIGQLAFGACAPEHGLIHVFLDNLLKTYGLTGFEPVEHWFTIHSTTVLIHELIHCLAPELTEEQVGVATERFMEAWFSPHKATRLIIHIGDRTFGHLLTENSQILEVKG